MNALCQPFEVPMQAACMAYAEPIQPVSQISKIHPFQPFSFHSKIALFSESLKHRLFPS